MELAQQREFINLYKQYQAIDRNTIKVNLKTYTDKVNLRPLDIAEHTKIPIQTVYQMRKLTSTYKPDFITSMIICDMLKIPITATMQPLTGNLILPVSEPVKWNVQVKRQFVKDYNNLNVLQLCKKYNITSRTAQEYNKNFKRDLDNLL